jgi:hypothetical protein
MPAAFLIRVLDSIIRIEFDGTLSVDHMEALRAPWRELQVGDHEQVDAIVRVVVGDIADPTGAVAAVSGDDPDLIAQSLSTTVTLQGIAKLRGRALLLHAAAISLDDGRVIGFIGPSGRGKTTAARALAQHYGYVTDETLAIRPDLSVIPYPKPLSVLVGRPPKHSIAPADLGMRPLPDERLTLAALVILDRRPGATEARIEEVDLVDAVGSIAPETSSLIALARPLGDLVDVVQLTGGVRRVVYADAAQLAHIIPRILEASCAPADVQPVAPSDGAASVATEDPIYRRVPWSDALRIGDRVLVHNGSRVVVLDGLGPLLWCAADGRDLGALVALATREIEPPTDVDAEAAIARRLDDMVEAGVLFTA